MKMIDRLESMLPAAINLCSTCLASYLVYALSFIEVGKYFKMFIEIFVTTQMCVFNYSDRHLQFYPTVVQLQTEQTI